MTVNSDADVVAFVGESNSGKSSIMRGVACLFQLDPFWPTIGAKSASVGASFDDVDVERRGTFKDKDGKVAKTSDKIILDGDEVNPFTKLHREMPAGVIEKTRMIALDIQGATKPFLLNFIGQHDQVLCKALKPSQLAKLLASVSGRGKVDNAIRTTNTIIKQQNKQHDSLTKSLEELDVMICDMQQQMPDIDLDVFGLIDDVHSLRCSVDAIQDYILIEKQVSDIELKMQHTQGVLKVSVDSEYEKLSAIEAALDIHLNSDKRINLSSAVEDKIKTINEDIDSYIAVYNAEETLCLTGEAEQEIITEGKAAREQLDVTKDDIASLIDKEGICPYSGQQLPDYCRKALVE